jgi:hypothetical protein
MDITNSLTKLAIGVFVLGGLVTFLNQNYELIFHSGQKTSMKQVLGLVPVSRDRVTFAVKSGINTCARDLVAPRPDSIILAVISAPILDILSLPAVGKGETPTEEEIDASRVRVLGSIVKDLEHRAFSLNRNWFTNQLESDSRFAEVICHAASFVERPA